jgi:hypothetical protein
MTPCNNCPDEPRRTEQPLRAPETAPLGPGPVTIIHTGGPVSTIWAGVRASIPASCDWVTIDDEGTIRYTKKGPDGTQPPSPPEGFEIVDELTFQSRWEPCRGRAYIAEVRECGCLHITAVCMVAGSGSYGSAVSREQCGECDHKQPIVEPLPLNRIPPRP